MVPAIYQPCACFLVYSNMIMITIGPNLNGLFRRRFGTSPGEDMLVSCEELSLPNYLHDPNKVWSLKSFASLFHDIKDKEEYMQSKLLYGSDFILQSFHLT